MKSNVLGKYLCDLDVRVGGHGIPITILDVARKNCASYHGLSFDSSIDQL
jgi:hypothetical protein